MSHNIDAQRLLQLIQKHVHTEQELINNDYELEEIPESKLHAFVKCSRCNIRWHKNDKNQLINLQNRANARTKVIDTGCYYHSGSWNHGRRSFSCCKGESGSEPCVHMPVHDFPNPPMTQLRADFQYSSTPMASPTMPKCAAVVLDLEMGINCKGDPEVIRVTMIDALTQEILIDSLVKPTIRMRKHSTDITHITEESIDDAVAEGKCIMGGRDGARAQVWKFVGPDTIMIGHALKNDLRAMRLDHKPILDTEMLARKKNRLSEAEIAENVRQEEAKLNNENPEQGFITVKSKASKRAIRQHLGRQELREENQKKRFTGLSLKSLTKFLLNWDVQTDAAGHDSLEDCRATLGIAIALFELPDPKVVKEDAWISDNVNLSAAALEEMRIGKKRLEDDS